MAVTAVTLDFTYEPVEMHVLVEGRTGEKPYIVKPEHMENNVLQLAPYSANYTVCGRFEDEGKVYEMEFYFRFILPEER